jgi:hypothetical protein
VDPRRFNDLDLAREAARAGMGAILIKSHQNSTVERAWLVSKVVTGIQVFGGTMGIPQIWVVDPEDGSFSRYEDSQLQRREEFSDLDRGIAFAMSGIKGMLKRTSRGWQV